MSGLPISELSDGYEIIFASLKNRLIINDVIRVFFKTLKENKNHIILNFKGCKPPSFPNIILSLSGIIKFYEINHGFNIEILTIEDSYLESVRMQIPYNVKENKEYLIESIFDKVIEFSTDFDIAFISDELLKQLQMQVICEEGVLVGTSWCMNEIMDNVLLHSGIERGFFMSQIHKRNKHIVIAIFDSGFGLQNTLQANKSYQVKSSSEAIKLAIKKGVTRDKTIGQGNGMWGLHQIILSNSGLLTIASGNSALVINESSESKETIFGGLPYLSKDYQSTLIDFMIDFSKYINMNTVLGDYDPFEAIQRRIEDLTDDEGRVVFKIADNNLYGTGTRSAGSKLRFLVINLYKVERKIVILDFDKIIHSATSFMDEFIGKLFSELGAVEFSKRYIIINTNDYLRKMILYVKHQRLIVD